MTRKIQVTHVRKRTGEIVPFRAEKIQIAVEKAMKSVNFPNFQRSKEAKKLTEEIIERINGKSIQFQGNIPSIEQIQNIVEEELIASPYNRVAKAYMLYRKSRQEARALKQFFNMHDDLKFGVNAIKVLEERYLLKDSDGKIIETPTSLFARVAKAIASVEERYGKNRLDIAKLEHEFFEMMKNLEFLPNSPTLMNAGTDLGQLSACFVLPIEDSLESIFSTLKNMAIIQQSGGGTGFSFSQIRPQGDIVKSTHGIASGPVSFLKIFDATTDVIKQGGKRRGANMGILHCNHPDIEKFIAVKRDITKLTNFNISVAATDDFMKAIEKKKQFSLINPRSKKVSRYVSAQEIFNEIIKSAWLTGDPGIIFIDEINRKHVLPEIQIESTNPCGEVPLIAYESCNIGSINLAKIIKDKKEIKKGTAKKEIDFDKLKKIIWHSIRFLDNVIDANKYPLQEIEAITKANRKIGLGVMGLADMLIQLEIPYDSNDALKIAEKIISFISMEARKVSAELGKEKGSFPNLGKSIFKTKFKTMRNATCTTIAPTGTISIIAGCSSGIEPLFAVSFIREIMEGKKLIESNPYFQTAAIMAGFYSEELMKKIRQKGSIQGIKQIPLEFRNIFKTALDIKAEWHVKMQAAFQKYVDNAVSKTVNLPEDATPKDIGRIYMLAYKLGCKGITVYRYGSKPEQVLYLGTSKEPLTAKVHYSGGCASGICPL